MGRKRRANGPSTPSGSGVSGDGNDSAGAAEPGGVGPSIAVVYAGANAAAAPPEDGGRYTVVDADDGKHIGRLKAYDAVLVLPGLRRKHQADLVATARRSGLVIVPSVASEVPRHLEVLTTTLSQLRATFGPLEAVLEPGSPSHGFLPQVLVADAALKDYNELDKGVRAKVLQAISNPAPEPKRGWLAGFGAVRLVNKRWRIVLADEPPRRFVWSMGFHDDAYGRAGARRSTPSVAPEWVHVGAVATWLANGDPIPPWFWDPESITASPHPDDEAEEHERYLQALRDDDADDATLAVAATDLLTARRVLAERRGRFR